MKVLSYLEFSDPQLKGKKNAYESFEHFAENKTHWDFYSQPFKPELITELFEIDYHYVIDCTDKYMNIGGLDGQYDEEYHPIYATFLPRTLDDFINDCQRAGIELTWRIK